MILTLTANPSLDRTIDLQAPLQVGGVHRIGADRTQVGGKGVNVALGLARAGVDTLALVPVGAHDPYLQLLDEAGLPHRASEVAGAVRTNLTVLSAPDVTTKINEPGSPVSAQEVAAVEAALLDAAGEGDAVMLSGSLAPGFPVDWYARMVRLLHERGLWAGVDTSDAPLTALAAAWAEDPACAPDLLKPNAEELGQLTGQDGLALESSAEQGELGPVREAALTLQAQGVGAVLVTLGGAGAVLATADGCWYSPTVRGPVVSTVGAGDSATAGFLIARESGQDEAGQLARAVAYGTAAVGLPGTTIPRPEQARVHPESVRPL